MTKKQVLANLQKIPGVGKSISQDLYNLGICSVADLKGKDPEELYLRHCAQKGMQIDRCLLYVFRCAIYYAENDVHDPNMLKWWHWKDE